MVEKWEFLLVGDKADQTMRKTRGWLCDDLQRKDSRVM